MFVVRTATHAPVVGLIHDCLLSQGSPFNLLSVSQFQASTPNSVDFSIDSPYLSVHFMANVRSQTRHVILPLTMDDGLYSFLAEPIHPNDDRYRALPRFDFTPKGQYGMTVGLDVAGLAWQRPGPPRRETEHDAAAGT
jgi:hypothetical protein